MKYNASVSASEIKLHANLSSVGKITCAATERGVPLTSIFDVINKGPAMLTVLDAASTSDVVVPLSGLTPDTAYSVYCYTQDFRGNGMDLAAVVATRNDITTPCCRKISFVTFPPQLEASSIELFSFKLDSLPRSPVRVYIKRSARACLGRDGSVLAPATSSALPKVVPDYFSFNADSLSLVGEFSVLAGTVSQTLSCFSVNISMVSFGTETPYIGESRVLTVTSSDAIPVQPVMLSAYLSDDARRIIVEFDSPTNQGEFTTGSFPCQKVLQFTGSEYVSCVWSTPQLLFANTFESPKLCLSKLQLGESIRLMGRSIKAACKQTGKVDCSAFVSSPTKEVPLGPPKSPTAPQVSLAGPRAVSECDDIVLDPSASIGDYGRPWRKIEWQVKASLDTVHVENVTKYLNTQTSLSLTISIPQKLIKNKFQDVVDLTFTLTARNFIGSYSVATVTVQMPQRTTVPGIIIAGPTLITTYRWKPLNLFAVASLPPCGDQNAYIMYVWKVFKGTTELKSVISQSPDKRSFSVPEFTFDTNTQYTIQAVSYTQSDFNSATCTLTVSQSKVVATLANGARRGITTSESVVFDASGSFDPDLSPSEQADPKHPLALSFTWTCIEFAPNFGNPCADGIEQAMGSASIISLDASYLDLSKSYKFSVIVSGSGERTATANQIIDVLSVPVPKLSIGYVAKKYNVDRPIIINATVADSVYVTVAAWTGRPLTTAALGAATALPLKIGVDPFSTANFQLALKPGSLKAGMVYTFTLSAWKLPSTSRAPTPSPTVYNATLKYPNETNATVVDVFAVVIDSSISVQVSTNEPPMGGSLQIDRREGNALNDTFLLETFSWADDPEDYPLVYSMSYYTVSAKQPTLIKSAGPSAYVRVYLAQGSAAMNFKVTCIVTASDMYGASNSATAFTIVRPNPDTKAMTQKANEQITLALQKSDPDLIAQVVGVVTSSVNTVDCSNSPNCNSLNRQLCSIVPNTCGPCNSGFLGPAGFANTLCNPVVIAKSPSRTQLTEFLEKSLWEDESLGVSGELFSLQGASTTGKTGDACLKGFMCLSGTCTTKGVCAAGYQTCPNQCTSAAVGKCRYVDRTGSYVSSCLLEDMYCKPKCECVYDRYGTDCSLKKTAWKDFRTARESMCKAALKAAGMQVLTSEILKARAVSVSLLLTDKSQVSDAALASCVTLLVDSVIRNALLVATEDTFNAVSETLSDVLIFADALPPNLLDKVALAISSMSVGRQSVLAVGQAGDEIVTANLRFYTQKLSLNELKSDSFAVPQSFLEQAYGLRKTAIAFPAVDTGGNNSVFGLTLVQFNSNPYDVFSNSTDTVIQLRNLESTGSPFSSIKLQLTLQNMQPVEYFDNPAVKRQIQCLPTGLAHNVTAHCPYGFEHNLACPGVTGAFVNYICPGSKRVPECHVPAYADSTSCSVIAFSRWNTTCECSIIYKNPTVKAAMVRNKVLRVLAAQSPNFFSADVLSYHTLKTTNFEYALATYAVPKAVMNSTVTVSSVLLLLAVFGIFFSMFARDLYYSGALKKAYTNAKKILSSLKKKFKKKNKSDEDGPDDDDDDDDDDIELTSLEQKKNDDSNADTATSVNTHYSINALFVTVLPEDIVKSQYFRLFLRKLRTYHKWLLFSDIRKRSTTTEWCILCFVCFNVLVAVTTVSSFLFPDDGYCEKLKSKSSCLVDMRIDYLDTRCIWDDRLKFCTFNRPADYVLSMIIIIALVNIVIAPLNKLVDILVPTIENRFLQIISARRWKVYAVTDVVTALEDELLNVDKLDIDKTPGNVLVNLGAEAQNKKMAGFNGEDKKDKIQSEETSKELTRFEKVREACVAEAKTELDKALVMNKFDSLRSLESRRSVVLKAARLAKMIKRMDDQNSIYELRVMYKVASMQVDANYVHDYGERFFSRSNVFGIIESLLYSIVLFFASPGNPKSASLLYKEGEYCAKSCVLHHIVRSRRFADKIARTIDAHIEHRDMHSDHFSRLAISAETANQAVATEKPLNEKNGGDKKVAISSKGIKSEVHDYNNKSEVIVPVSEKTMERYLLQQFILHYLRGYKFNLFKRFIDAMDETTHHSMAHHVSTGGNVYVHIIVFTTSAILLIAYIAIALVYMNYYSSFLGSRSLGYWGYGVSLSILFEGLLVEPVSIFFTWVCSAQLVRAEALKIRDVLQFRARRIMTRTQGLMLSANALIQHFNPACRAARKHPNLPVSRLLMVLNDFDLPVKFKSFESENLELIASICRVSVLPVARLFAYVFTSLPYSVQDVLLTVLSSVLIAVVIIGLHFAEVKLSVFVPWGVVLVGMLTSTVFFYIWYRREYPNLSTASVVPLNKAVDDEPGAPIAKVWDKKLGKMVAQAAPKRLAKVTDEERAELVGDNLSALVAAAKNLYLPLKKKPKPSMLALPEASADDAKNSWGKSDGEIASDPLVKVSPKGNSLQLDMSFASRVGKDLVEAFEPLKDLQDETGSASDRRDALSANGKRGKQSNGIVRKNGRSVAAVAKLPAIHVESVSGSETDERMDAIWHTSDEEKGRKITTGTRKDRNKVSDEFKGQFDIEAGQATGVSDDSRALPRTRRAVSRSSSDAIDRSADHSKHRARTTGGRASRGSLSPHKETGDDDMAPQGADKDGIYKDEFGNSAHVERKKTLPPVRRRKSTHREGGSRPDTGRTEISESSAGGNGEEAEQRPVTKRKKKVKRVASSGESSGSELPPLVVHNAAAKLARMTLHTPFGANLDDKPNSAFTLGHNQQQQEQKEFFPSWHATGVYDSGAEAGDEEGFEGTCLQDFSFASNAIGGSAGEAPGNSSPVAGYATAPIRPSSKSSSVRPSTAEVQAQMRRPPGTAPPVPIAEVPEDLIPKGKVRSVADPVFPSWH